ncbi:hypothetical protein POM88_046498 [Heracleum sosnowskyi]|uniref:SWIM-type domain-containing protein n=1 Tax=Heracleum sosnowskyi TaxID=360622 RepID=A0AAD8H939_9APIA|nr:hypothetical protein POM88_046498 [Heracleum sosnowskyi]
MFIEEIDAGNYIVPLENDNSNFTYVQEEYMEAEDPNTNMSPQVQPILGQVFSTMDEAYHFYNTYALDKGFGIRMGDLARSRVTNEVIRKKFVCCKEGKKYLGDKRQVGKNVKHRRDTRTDCKAKMEISLKNGEWLVDKFYDVHNHDLTHTPSKVIKYRSHSKFHRTESCKNLISELHQNGLKSSDITKVVNVVTCSTEVDITPRQCYDYLRSERKNYVGKECYGIVKHFQEKAAMDDNHYFTMDLAKDGTLRSVFWADGRSRTSYLQFGDVVVFDVTYKTNKFKMPFAPFIGVNHHGQSILFGGALLEDETEDTFTWLFEQFLTCMFGKAPKAIITDQDAAMKISIKKVFPNAYHRFCAWHINKHVIENLQSYRARYTDFEETFSKWVKSKSIEEFENGWTTFQEKYVVEKGSWLYNMYDLRRHWVKVYMKEVFLAGMTTSGRSESINAFFDGYVNSNTMLSDFVIQYDKALASRRKKEEDEDFVTIDSCPTLLTGHPIEQQAGKYYTRNIYELFKKEWQNSFSYTHEKINKDIQLTNYIVGQHAVDKFLWRTVQYDASADLKVVCSYTKFETRGILCKHILYLMRKKKLDAIPDHYILHRWTIGARYKADNSGKKRCATGDYYVTPMNIMLVRTKFSKALQNAMDFPAEIEDLDSYLDKFMDRQSKRRSSSTVGIKTTQTQVMQM